MSTPETLSERALERRLKRHLRKAPQTFFAVCAPGFEDVLLEEIRHLPDVSDSVPDTGGVSFIGPLDTFYHANLHLRSAHRVLLRIDTFLAQNYPTLFDRVTRLPWELYLGFSPHYSVRVSARESRLRHHKNIAKTLGDGIQAALEPLGLSPTEQANAPLELHVRFYRDTCTLSLNTSGEHLHKRGYRTLTGEAPLRETLAAGVLLACDAPTHDLILDPMCGSGTLLIEAALLATNTPPGLARDFAFEHAPFFQTSKWERFKHEAAEAKRLSPIRLIGNDIDGNAIELARQNAASAGVGTLVEFGVGDALELPPPDNASRPLLVSNLPYGQRLGDQSETGALLESFAAHLKKAYAGWAYAFVTHESDWLERAGIEIDEVRTFRNGGLAVRLVRGRV